MSSFDSNTPLFPRASLHPAVLAWADAHTGDGGTCAPWCVAFSGGADSLALLLALREIFPRQMLVALHFNHHLRGAASDGDERFCRETCAALGVEIRIGHWEHSNCDAGVSEAEARTARHAFINREMVSLGANALWLGHQLDDIAETQLMRLARGSSTAGLAAPRSVHVRDDGCVFLRPLLTLSKRQITDALSARGFAWREDATNGEGDFFRNRIRRDVLPVWIAAAENDALAGAALTREFLDEDAAALDAWVDELMGDLFDPAAEPSAAWKGRSPVKTGWETRPPVAGKMPALPGNALDLRPLAGKPRALFRRVLRRWPLASELARAGFEALLEICIAGKGQVSIGDQIAIFEGGILRAEPASAEAGVDFRHLVTPPFDLVLPDGAKLTASCINLTEELRADIFAGKYDPINTIFISPPTATSTTFTVRSWQSGDRYQPLGSPGSAKVSDLFINRKIPQTRRLSLPVVCIAREAGVGFDEIIWIPGLPPAHPWKICAQTPQALRLTYQGGTCTVKH